MENNKLRFLSWLAACSLCCAAGCVPNEPPSEANQQRPNNDAFHIAWYEGKLTGLPGHLEFTHADTGRTVPAYAAPAFDATVGERRFMLKDHSNCWLGAYCRSREDFRLLARAITAIQGEFGHDPPGTEHSFQGEGFYFLTSITKADASR